MFNKFTIKLALIQYPLFIGIIVFCWKW
jgi:hypothetical protein